MSDKFLTTDICQKKPHYSHPHMPSHELPRESYFQLLESTRCELAQLQKINSPKAAKLIATIQQLVNLGEARGLL
jgi:hypothetical protein